VSVSVSVSLSVSVFVSLSVSVFVSLSVSVFVSLSVSVFVSLLLCLLRTVLTARFPLPAGSVRSAPHGMTPKTAAAPISTEMGSVAAAAFTYSFL